MFSLCMPTLKPYIKLNCRSRKKRYEDELKPTKVTMVEAFKSLIEFHDIKANFGVALYVQGIIDLKKKVKKIASNFDLSLLESDNEEEVSKGGDEGLRVEDLFSPECEDRRVEEVVLAILLTVIILSDRAEVEHPPAP